MGYSYFALMGSAGTGNTSSMNKINQAYQDQSKLSKYNLDDAHLNNGAITHTFFLSPTIDCDQTYQKSKSKDNRINIPFVDSNGMTSKQKLLMLCQELQKMKTIINL
ncbi:hypothetical protein SS50377_26229 [Spironucleus salmonicida]|uniref:Uncharacterized protein n=1 Tax=Spironucleus salmonicida TaxID=348837 RepID=A0A9P8RWP5_9EUKA|nr:hypothetical protein SS50377_26229 [Spironucleus salmonicida]